MIAVTFLFTDIEGSTRLWEARPEAMRAALARHDALLRDRIEGRGGRVFKTLGDAFCAAFASPADAVGAALAAQSALVAAPWPGEAPLRVRMALHTGVAEERDGDYFGPPLNRVARLLSVVHGGQVVVSAATQELVRDYLPDGASLRGLGEHRLKDLGRPESVYQLCHPDLPADFPPLRSLDNPDLKHNLPEQVTSFIGREAQIAEVKELLGKTRLLTLTGAGGSGKTRLALQVAADLLDGSGDGAWLVELAPLTDPGLVVATITSVLGLKEEAGRPILQTLTEHLRALHLLLILDNCEHLLDACATLSDTLLRSCPRVLILATSREGLGIAGETTYRVPSLSLPDPQRDATPERLSQFESVRLFVERAARFQTTFAVTSQNAPALASVCHRLDGIPLAIELAAARVRAMHLEQIEQRLDHRFQLLTGGSRTALPRQQTLRSMIDWSYDLLDDSEKALLRRLSVFSGGWTLEAAEAVCAGGMVEEWDVLDLLTSLVDKSLANFQDTLGEGRYRFLETVRQYGWEKLEQSGEVQTVRTRHRDYFLSVAEEAEPQLQGPAQAQWLERLGHEHENLRASLDWSLSDSRAEAGLRLCGALGRYYWTRGYFTEGRERFDRVLGKGGGNTRERAKALYWAGGLALGVDDYASLRTCVEASLAIYQEIGDLAGIASALNGLGLGAYHQGDYAAARDCLEKSLAIFRETGDPRGVANALGNLGYVVLAQGDHASALLCCEESLAVNRDTGNRRGIADALNSLGRLAHHRGDHTLARKYVEESLSLYREVGDRFGTATALCNLGRVAQAENDHRAAWAHHVESLSLLKEIGDRFGIATSLEVCAGLMAAQDRMVCAAELWGAAERLREQIGAPLPPNERAEYRQEVGSTRAKLGEEAFDAAWAGGRALSLTQAVGLVLEQAEHEGGGGE